MLFPQVGGGAEGRGTPWVSMSQPEVSVTLIRRPWDPGLLFESLEFGVPLRGAQDASVPSTCWNPQSQESGKQDFSQSFSQDQAEDGVLLCPFGQPLEIGREGGAGQEFSQEAQGLTEFKGGSDARTGPRASRNSQCAGGRAGSCARVPEAAGTPCLQHLGERPGPASPWRGPSTADSGPGLRAGAQGSPGGSRGRTAALGSAQSWARARLHLLRAGCPPRSC